MIASLPRMPRWPLMLALAAATGFTLSAIGCRQYEVKGSKVRDNAPRDSSAATARLRVKPGLRSGLSEQAQDIEKSVGY